MNSKRIKFWTTLIANPGALSVAEVIQLDAYYWGVVDQMLNAQVAWGAGIRDGSFAVTADQAASIYFANGFAQAWWRQARDTFSDAENLEFRRVMDTAINSVSSSGYPNPYRRMLREISPSGEGVTN